jgi:hypothetical protein
METLARIRLEGLELNQKAAQQDAENARELLSDLTKMSDNFMKLNDKEISNERRE